jgi:SAM-dependent methyltransferase
MSELKLYTELAPWFRLLTAPEDYAEESALYVGLFREHGEPPVQSLVELGSGGGHNASHMKAHFREVVLVEPSAGMRDMSRELNPDCEHLEGDMRTVRLGRQFDCVFIHDAICYMTTRDDLRQAIETAYAHCRPGGVALFAPDVITENWREIADCGGHNGADGRGLRYVHWSWDPDPADEQYVVDYALLLRERDGSVRVEHDRHLEGIFPRAVWLGLLADAGFTAVAVPVEHSEVDPGTYEMFVARRPHSMR